jgi:hypothetical protein
VIPEARHPGLHQAGGKRSYMAGRAVLRGAQCQPSLTHFPKWRRHGKAAFRPSAVSLGYIIRLRGGWRRPWEYQSYLWRVSGECPARVRCVSHDSQAPAIGPAYTTEVPPVCLNIGHFSPAPPEMTSSTPSVWVPAVDKSRLPRAEDCLPYLAPPAPQQPRPLTRCTQRETAIGLSHEANSFPHQEGSARLQTP